MDKTYTLDDLSKLDPGTTIICDDIPYNMTCSFFTYKDWEVQIIRNVIEYKKKYKKWPNFLTAHPVTFDNCTEEVEKILASTQQNTDTSESTNEFDWNTFDIEAPIENYPIQAMSIDIHEGLFSTPLFTFLWLDCNSYKEGIYKLSFGINPGPDDGEEIDKSDEDEPLKLRLAA